MYPAHTCYHGCIHSSIECLHTHTLSLSAPPNSHTALQAADVESALDDFESLLPQLCISLELMRASDWVRAGGEEEGGGGGEARALWLRVGHRPLSARPYP